MTRGEILKNGLWRNNSALVALLGLCPLLAVSGTVVTALGLGLATVLVLMLTNLLTALIRPLLLDEIRVACFVLIIAAAVTAIELLIHAWLHELYLALGIYLPLIVTNCMILGRAEAFASRNSPGRAVLDGAAHGTGFLLVLVALGAARELLGYGTLLRNADMLFGPGATGFEITLLPMPREFLLAVLPPGAFMALGGLVALRQWHDQRRDRPAAAAVPEPA